MDVCGQCTCVFMYMYIHVYVFSMCMLYEALAKDLCNCKVGISTNVCAVMVSTFQTALCILKIAQALRKVDNQHTTHNQHLKVSTQLHQLKTWHGDKNGASN